MYWKRQTFYSKTKPHALSVCIIFDFVFLRTRLVCGLVVCVRAFRLVYGRNTDDAQ